MSTTNNNEPPKAVTQEQIEDVLWSMLGKGLIDVRFEGGELRWSLTEKGKKTQP